MSQKKQSKLTHTTQAAAKGISTQALLSQSKKTYRSRTRILMRWLFAPVLLYSGIFFLSQPQYIAGFSRGFYLDNGDGFQNVWNIWWVNKALVINHVSPYFTDMVHWPHGVTLIPQTMNIFNGLVAIPLMHLFGMSLVQVTNVAVLLGFILGGTTMFWFLYKLHKNYTIALIGGALFTFSSYHFAHAQGHLQLVSLEFIPLFFLSFWTLLEKMRYRYAAGAAVSLFLVLLCDYYYLLWSIIVAGLWFVWVLYRKQIKLTRQHLRVLGVFLLLVVILVGPLMYKLVHLNKTDPLVGGHNPLEFSLDPLMIFFPGGSWYWHSLTDNFTMHLPYLAESSNFFGYGLLSVLGFGLYKFVTNLKKPQIPHWLSFWWLIAFVFGLMSLGPRFTFLQRHVDRIPMPYAIAEHVLPTLKISGMPLRWILITLMASIVIVTYWLNNLNLTTRKGRLLLALFVAVSIIDLWPRRSPLTSPAYRQYVYELERLPYGAVIDNGALSGAEQLYNQTLHNKPQAFGYVTRLTKSVDEKDFHIFAALEEHHYDSLCRDYKIRYITLPTERPLANTTFPVIYNDGQTLIYDLKNSPNC